MSDAAGMSGALSSSDGFATDLEGCVAELRPPHTRGGLLGRYVVLDRLGAGGMGVVYAAWDPELDRKVAIKLLRATAVAPGLLLHEAKALARLSHPNVVAVHDVGTLGGQVFVAMEFVDGCTLRRWLAEAPRSQDEVLRVLLLAGQGLAAAHAAGLVHRDFKPDNVMVGRDGRVRVMDFGLARVTEAAAPGSNTPTSGFHTVSRAGTPAYMAPEQYEGGRLGPRTDQFAFCVTAWECLCGEHPFAQRTALATAQAILRGRARPVPRDVRLPRAVVRALQRGLSVDPRGRFPDLGALLAALERDPRPQLRRIGQGLLGFGALVGAALGARELMRPGEVEVVVTAGGRPLAPARATVGERPLVVHETGARGHVPAGIHVLRVEAADHVAREAVVTVERGGSVHVALELQHEQGRFDLDVEPAGSTVLIDGVDYGSRLANVAVDTGPHELLVRRPGHHDARLRWTAEAGRTTAGYASLAPAEIWSVKQTGPKHLLVPLGDVDGDSRVDVLHDVFNEFTAADPWTGTPLWRLEHARSTFTRHLVEDLDGDGVRDLVVASKPSERANELHAYSGRLQRARGELGPPDLLWSWRARPSQRFETPLAAVDIDRDGAREIVTQTGPGELTAFAGDGRVRWTVALGGAAFGLAFAGLGDPASERLLALTPDASYALDPATGAVLWRAALDRPGPYSLADRMFAGDLDGDGELDLVTTVSHAGDGLGFIQARRGGDGAALWTSADASDAPWILRDMFAGPGGSWIVLHGQGRVKLLDGRTGAERLSLPTDGAPSLLRDPARAEPLLVRAVGGRLELHDLRTGAAVRSLPLDGPGASPPTMHDWDGDGDLELMFASSTGTVIAYDAQDRVVGSLYLGDVLARSAEPAGDLDGDGLSELVVETSGMHMLLRGPKVLWSRTMHDAVRTTPRVADLDADGALEVVVGTVFDGHIGVHAFAAATGAYAFAERPLQSRADVIRPPALLERGDGGLDALFVNPHGNPPQVLRVDPRGAVVATAPGYHTYATPGVADLDGDGRLEVLVTPWDPGELVAFDPDTLARRWSLALPAGGWTPPLALPAGDRTLGVVYLLDGSLRAFDGQGRTWLWSQDLGDSCQVAPTPADLDGDGALELVAPTSSERGDDLVALRLADGALLWRLPDEGARRQRPAVADVDGDGSPEIFTGSRHGVARLDRHGVVRWRYRPSPHLPAAPVPDGGPVLADLDGDGALELLTNTADGTLHVLDAATGALRWTFHVGARLEAAPTPADVDGDGVQEVFLAAHDHALYLLRTPTARPRDR